MNTKIKGFLIFLILAFYLIAGVVTFGMLPVNAVEPHEQLYGEANRPATVLASEDSVGSADNANTKELELSSSLKNGIYLSPGLLAYYMTPSIGYIRFITKQVFWLNYLNYSKIDRINILGSNSGTLRENIDSENEAYLIATGPAVSFHTWHWPDAKTQLYCGLMMGYYTYSIKLKPGEMGGNRPEPPASVSGKSAWQGLAGGANLGILVIKPEGVFFLLGAGLIAGKSQIIDYQSEYVNGMTRNGSFNHSSLAYSYSFQISLAIGLAF